MIDFTCPRPPDEIDAALAKVMYPEVPDAVAVRDPWYALKWDLYAPTNDFWLWAPGEYGPYYRFAQRYHNPERDARVRAVIAELGGTIVERA